MPIKLIPNLRILNPALPLSRLSSMKPITAVRSSTRPIPIFSRVFPHKIKYQLGFPTSLSQSGLVSVRRLSTRSIRNRPGSSGEVRASKSLIDDEAELSDWVSGLNSDPFKTRVYSSDDNDFGRGRDNDRSRGRDDRGGRERVQPVKRRRDSDSDEGSAPSRSMGRDSYGSPSRNSPPRPGREIPGRDDRFGARRDGGRGDRFGARREGGRDDRFGSRRDSGPAKPMGSRGRDAYGKDDMLQSQGRGNVQNRQMGRDLRGDARLSRNVLGKDDGFVRQSRENGQRWESNAVASKTAPRRGGFATSTEEISESDEEKGPSKSFKSFTELVSEEDSDDDGDVDFDDGDIDVRDDVLSFAPKKSSSSQTSSAGESESYLSESRFDQCSVSPLSLKGIKDAGYEKMTVVQEATLPLILKGKDVLAKAKTGTGKTVAFLLPSIEVVVKSPPVDRDSKRPPILVLVICPTRELANQAAAEANKLIKYHHSIGVQVVIGGTRLATEQKRIQSNPCQILVATPGRLKDHIENTSGFATKLMGVKVLVLDEADHLLDMGFRKDIERIIAAVPKQRQTLLFSATVPPEVRQMCHIALKRDHDFVDTVGEDNEQTHAQVSQMHMVSPLDNHFPLLYSLLKEHISDDVDYKVLVFCTTAMVTRLVSNFLGELNLNVREIHSRKPQSYRTRVSDEFRKSKGLILVTSDVSARGVDYPDVTLVIQVGLPSDREQYIHRLGRTGRKGREGQGVLVLAPWEEFFLSSIKDLPISKAPLPLIDPETRKKVESALSQVDMKNKEAAYQAWLGYYNSNKTVARDKSRLVELANDFSRSMGLATPPAISKLVLGKMGLRNVPGLRSK